MMKKITTIVLVAILVACNNNGSKTETKDSTTINTTTGNVSDGGPNNGLGDTASYDRMNDKVPDTIPKK
jgi:hypothetical protein